MRLYLLRGARNMLLQLIATLLLSLAGSSSLRSGNDFDKNDGTRIIIPPDFPPLPPDDPPDPEVPDLTSSFSNALPISLGISNIVDTFQTSSDIDYYSFTSTRSDYVKFYLFSITSTYTYNLRVYRSTDLINPIKNYSLTSGNLPNDSYGIYVEQNETVYFTLREDFALPSLEIGDEPDIIVQPTYSPATVTANTISGTGDPQDYTFYDNYARTHYNGGNTRTVYFENSVYFIVNGNKTALDLISEAMVIWNKVGTIQFIQTTNIAQCDIIVSTSDQPNPSHGYGSFYMINEDYNLDRIMGEISLNRLYMPELTNSESLNAVLHEMGHSIALKHHDVNSNDTMYKYAHSFNGKLSKSDIGCYRYLYG